MISNATFGEIPDSDEDGPHDDHSTATKNIVMEINTKFFTLSLQKTAISLIIRGLDRTFSAEEITEESPRYLLCAVRQTLRNIEGEARGSQVGPVTSHF